MFISILDYKPRPGIINDEASKCVPCDSDLSLRTIIDKYTTGLLDPSEFNKGEWDDDGDESFDGPVDPAVDIVDDPLTYAQQVKEEVSQEFFSRKKAKPKSEDTATTEQSPERESAAGSVSDSKDTAGQSSVDD